jgi:gluconolactonase
LFFHPPKDLETRVFARLPDEFRKADPNNEWARYQPKGSPARSLLEGPSFDRNGHLWCVDLPNGRIYRITLDGAFHVAAEYDGWPNGLKFHKDGRIFIADYKNGIMEMDPVNGKVRPYITRASLAPFKGCNDLFFAANGDLYFTDQGLTGLHDPTGRLFRLTEKGQLDCLLDNVPSPNGLVMNLAENMVYLAVTRGNCIWRVPLSPDGGVAKVGIYIQLSGGWGVQMGWRSTPKAACSSPMSAWARCGWSMRWASRSIVSGLAPSPTPPTWRSAVRTTKRCSSPNPAAARS